MGRRDPVPIAPTFAMLYLYIYPIGERSFLQSPSLKPSGVTMAAPEREKYPEKHKNTRKNNTKHQENSERGVMLRWVPGAASLDGIRVPGGETEAGKGWVWMSVSKSGLYC